MGKINPYRRLIRALIILIILIFPGKMILAQQAAALESKIGIKWATKTYVPVAVSPDGKYMAKSFNILKTTSEKNAVQLFDLRTMRSLKQFKHDYVVTVIKFFPDNKRIITGYGYRGKLTIWDVETGLKIREFDAGNSFHTIDISKDGNLLLLGSGNCHKTTIIDLSTYETILTVKTKRETIARFIDNDKKILTAGGYYDEGGKSLFLWDIHSGELLSQLDLPQIFYSHNSTLSVSWNDVNFTISGSGETYYGKVENNKIIQQTYFDSFSRDIVYPEDPQKIYLINRFSLIAYNTNNGKEISRIEIKKYLPNATQMIFQEKKQQELVNIVSVNKGKHFIITDDRNVSYIYSVDRNQIMAYMYTFNDNDYAFVTPDGRMEGSKEAIENLQWVVGDKRIPLSNTYDQMYTPNLLAQIFENKLEASTTSLNDIIKFTPEIKITSPAPDFKTTNAAISVNCDLKENGDEIKQVRIYVNDKLVSDETRGMKAAGSSVTYNITLLPGVNSVKAVAITRNGYQSTPAEISVNYEGAVAESRLFVMTVGIDKYKNPSYNLNFADADAAGIAEKIRMSAGGIFRNIALYSYRDEKAVKDSILHGFRNIASQTQPQDAFVFFYAGHGVMSEGTPEVPKDFFLALYDVTQLYGRDDMLQTKGISAAELREASKQISAQKQIIFIDACQSGAAVETFAMRGAAEEKAILQLARSTGSYLIASTGSEQYASEFSELGHGVFTYSILEGMSCKNGEKDKKITIKELEAYLNDNIPTLTVKYHGTVQYPKSWSKGMDFPIAVCK